MGFDHILNGFQVIYSKEVLPRWGWGHILNGFQIIFSNLGDPQGSCREIVAPIPGRTAIAVGRL